jgi:hypothetical protein
VTGVGEIYCKAKNDVFPFGLLLVSRSKINRTSCYIHSLLEILNINDYYLPITVARSNAEIVGSNPTEDMDVCMCVYSVFLLSCV